jgi:hypothetical protein
MALSKKARFCGNLKLKFRPEQPKGTSRAGTPGSARLLSLLNGRSPAMANQRDPYDPLDPGRSRLSDGDFDPAARLEREAQFDPELAEGPARTGRIALFAIALALLLGAVFYGLNNSRVHEASTVPPAQTSQQNPASSNNQPGTTTGSAATTRPTPPQSLPAGSEVDRAANPVGQKNDKH